MPVDVEKLVAVKAEEWQRRTSKVMSQARPHLDVVRELFEEGQELGYEELIQGVWGFYFLGIGVTVHFAFPFVHFRINIREAFLGAFLLLH